MSLQHSRRQRSFTLLLAFAIAAVLGGPAQVSAQRTSLAARDGAFIDQDGKDRWVVGNDRVTLSVGMTTKGALAIFGIGRPGAPAAWSLDAAADLRVTAGDRQLTPGQGDFRYRSARIDDVDGSLRLSLVFESPSGKLRATRTYACYPGTPAIETWTIFEPYQTAAGVALADIGIWELSVAGSAVNWVTGLRTPEADGGAFTRQRVPVGVSAQLGSSGRSSTDYVPVVWIDGPAGHLVAGLLWSGAWAITVTPPGPGGRSAVRASLGSITTTLENGSPLETPHGFYAVAADGDVSGALRTYFTAGVRRGRPFSPQVTFNTWYAYGVHISESALLEQLDHAARLGAERFVVDAGWYTGGAEMFDFATGLGRWSADSDRFPSGLRALANRTHEAGLAFGIWMEPEHADLSTVGPEGMVQERWLATSGGRYKPDAEVPPTPAPAPDGDGGEEPVTEIPVFSSAQICLSSPEARQWILDQVSRLVEESGADYLKWDNNFWINCDRPEHGHGQNDGNLAHHLGLYAVLEQLRARFPNLIIENCAEGGNRLDPGMLRYTDAAWMDDVTSPSSHVRHNLEGLGAVYPPAYLLSFVKDDASEPLMEATDMAATVRSRMPGALGVSLLNDAYGDDDLEAMQAEIARYKDLRYILMDASLLLLTPQNGAPDGDGWDVLELLSASTGDAIVHAFASEGSTDGTVVRLRGLKPETRYRVRRAEGDVIGDATGLALMQDGIGISRTPASASVMLVVAAAPIDEPPATTIRR